MAEETTRGIKLVLEVITKGREKLNQYAPGLAKIGGQAKKLGKNLGDLRKKFSKVDDGLADNVKSMMKWATVAAAAFGAVKEAVDFESAFADVRKVVEGTDKEINALRGDILEMTRAIPQSASELSAIAAAAGQLGTKVEDIGQFVNTVSQMSTAFSMTAGEAGESVGKIQNIFRLSVNELSGFGDTVNALGNTMAARESEIIDVMKRIGGSTRVFGLATHEAAALSASFVALGQSPEVAGTAINSMLNKLATASSQGADFQEALASIGMSAEALGKNIREDASGALTVFLEKLALLSGDDLLGTLTDLFGQEFAPKIATLVSSLDTYKDALGNVADQAKIAGSMQKEFEARSKTTANQIQLAKNAVSRLAVELGDKFLPSINKALKAMIAFLDRFKGSTAQAALEAFGSQLSSLGDSAKEAFSIISKAWRDFNKDTQDGSVNIGKFLADAFVNLPANVKSAIGLATVMMASWRDSVIAFCIYIKEAMAAVFNDDTIANATARFNATKGTIDSAYEQSIDAILKERDAAVKASGDKIKAVQKEREELEKTHAEKEKQARQALANAGVSDPEAAQIEEQIKKLDALDAKKKAIEAKKPAEKKAGEPKQEEEIKKPKAWVKNVDGSYSDNPDYAKTAPAKSREKTQAEIAAEDARDELESKKRLVAIQAQAKEDELTRQNALAKMEAEKRENSYEDEKRIMAAKQAAAEAEFKNAKALIWAEVAERQKAYEKKQHLVQTELDKTTKAHEEKMALLKKEYEQTEQIEDAEEKDKAQSANLEKQKAAEERYANLKGDLDAQLLELESKNAEEGLGDSEKLGDASRAYRNRLEELDREDTEARKREGQRQAEEEARAIADAEAKIQEEAAKKEAEKEEKRKAKEARSAQRRSREKGRRAREQEARKEVERLAEDAPQVGKAQEEAANEEAQRLQDELLAQEEQAQAERLAMVKETEQAQEEASRKRLEDEKRTNEAASSAYRQYVDNLKAAMDDLEARQRKQQEELVDLDPFASEETKWQQRADMAKQYEEQAKQALKVGNFKDALEMSDKASEMYKGLRSGSGSLNENMVKQSIYEGVKSSGDLAQQIQQAMAGQLAAQTRAAQKGASNTSQTPSKRVELSFRGGSLEGSENAVEALLRQLEQAGLTA